MFLGCSVGHCAILLRLEDAAVQNFESPLIDALRPGAGKGTKTPKMKPRKPGLISKALAFSVFEFKGGEKFQDVCCNLKIYHL